MTQNCAKNCKKITRYFSQIFISDISLEYFLEIFPSDIFPRIFLLTYFPQIFPSDILVGYFPQIFPSDISFGYYLQIFSGIAIIQTNNFMWFFHLSFFVGHYSRRKFSGTSLPCDIFACFQESGNYH